MSEKLYLGKDPYFGEITFDQGFCDLGERMIDGHPILISLGGDEEFSPTMADIKIPLQILAKFCMSLEEHVNITLDYLVDKYKLGRNEQTCIHVRYEVGNSLDTNQYPSLLAMVFESEFFNFCVYFDDACKLIGLDSNGIQDVGTFVGEHTGLGSIRFHSRILRSPTVEYEGKKVQRFLYWGDVEGHENKISFQEVEHSLDHLYGFWKELATHVQSTRDLLIKVAPPSLGPVKVTSIMLFSNDAFNSWQDCNTEEVTPLLVKFEIMDERASDYMGINDIEVYFNEDYSFNKISERSSYYFDRLPKHLPEGDIPEKINHPYYGTINIETGLTDLEPIKIDSDIVERDFWFEARYLAGMTEDTFSPCVLIDKQLQNLLTEAKHYAAQHLRDEWLDDRVEFSDKKPDPDVVAIFPKAFNDRGSVSIDIFSAALSLDRICYKPGNPDIAAQLDLRLLPKDKDDLILVVCLNHEGEPVDAYTES